jgi:hypothetical protein
VGVRFRRFRMRDVEDCPQVLESLAVKEIVGFGKIRCHGFRHVVLHDLPHAPIVGGLLVEAQPRRVRWRRTHLTPPR